MKTKHALSFTRLSFIQTNYDMKQLLTLLLILCIIPQSFGSTFTQLRNINRCWNDHQNIDLSSVSTNGLTDQDLIRLHLSLVEKTLRQEIPQGLSNSQIKARLHCLDILNSYWRAGRFPQNEDYSYRTPIFIDKQDNFCAVGYLVKSTGFEHVSRKISRETNLAYVKEMNYPELLDWAKQFGFTVDELAWIQPSYGPMPTRHAASVGNGTNGTVRELTVSADGQKLYVGGEFTTVDNSVTANHIAYVTEQNGSYTWHNMGTGVNGTVHAIAEFDNKVYVGGSFTQAGGQPISNIAVWDGNTWSGLGCIYGTVYDLAVIGGALYAAGDFDVCGGSSEVNFAKWTGSTWQPLGGLDGHVNTIEVINGEVFLGGLFTYNNAQVNAIRWNAGIPSYTTFTAAPANEVTDFQMFRDSVYAVCRRSSNTDSMLILKLSGNSWAPVTALPQIALEHIGTGNAALHTLCAQADTLMMGGDFIYAPMMSNAFMLNSGALYTAPGATNWFNVNNAVYKMTVFKGELYAAGAFTGGQNYQTGDTAVLNHIARKGYPGITRIPDQGPVTPEYNLYPNPAVSGSAIGFVNDINATVIKITDVLGREVMNQPLAQPGKLQLPQLSPGQYNVMLINTAGNRKIEKLIIR